MSTTFYLFDQGEQRGPLTLGQLQSMWRAGSISAEAQICQAGHEEWQPAAPVLDVAEQPAEEQEESGVAVGPVLVIVGTCLCLIGVLGFFTAPPMIALALLGIGFLLAVVGRLSSVIN